MRSNVNVVNMTKLRSNTISYRNGYDVNLYRKHVWLQKLCVYFLRKLGCVKWDARTGYSFTTIDSQEIAEKLNELNESLFINYHTLNGKVLLIGPKQFRELNDSSLDPGYGVRFRIEYSMKDEFEQLAYNGMPIEVIPWMDGMLIVPDRVVK